MSLLDRRTKISVDLDALTKASAVRLIAGWTKWFPQASKHWSASTTTAVLRTSGVRHSMQTAGCSGGSNGATAASKSSLTLAALKTSLDPPAVRTMHRIARPTMRHPRRCGRRQASTILLMHECPFCPHVRAPASVQHLDFTAAKRTGGPQPQLVRARSHCGRTMIPKAQ